MRYDRTSLQIFAVAAIVFSASGMARAMTLDEAFKKLETHKFGQNHQVLDFLRDAALRGLEVRSFSDEVRTPISILDLCRILGVLLEQRPAGLLHLAGPEALDRHTLGLKIRDVFDLLGFGHIIEAHESVDDATAAFELEIARSLRSAEYSGGSGS